LQISALSNGVQNHKRNQQNNNSPQFKGAEQFLMMAAKPLQMLEADPIKGVVFLDVTTAIAPNTAIDTVERNPAQGFETFRRESSGLVINCLLPGVAVVGTAFALKNSILGNEFKHIPAQRIWANDETLTESAATWKKVAGETDKEKRVRSFIEENFKRIKPNAESLMVKGTDAEQKAAKESVQNALKILSDAILDPNPPQEKGFMASIGNGIKKAKNSIFGEPKMELGISNAKLNEVAGHLSKAYGQSTGVEITRLVQNDKTGKTFSTDMKKYIRDNFSLARAFDDKAIATHGVDKFTERMQKLLKVKSGATMVGVGALALAMHTINRKITEKMTGRKGYSGYKNIDGGNVQSPEDKGKLFGGKLLASAWFGSLAFLSMGVPELKMFNFAAPTTTMHQARALSLVTDIGRVNAASDKNELKDTMMRDTLIFANLYVLGDIVKSAIVQGVQSHYKSKGVDLNLLNESAKPTKKDSFVKHFNYWVKGKSVKSIEEIEGTIAKGASVQKRKNVVIGASLASLGYSLGALGIIAPIMIAKITNHNRDKELAKTAAKSTSVVSVAERGTRTSKPGLEALKQANVKAPKMYTTTES